MEYILNYSKFNESKGISDSCEYILNNIWEEIKDDILNCNDISKNFTFNKDDFKVKDIQINFNFNKGSENTCGAISNLKDSFIKNSYLEQTRISFDVRYNKMDESFIYYIKSVIFHEILHIFQHYNIMINDKFRPESFSIGSVIPQIRKNIKTEYISYMLDILYFSLSHELSAQIHQYYIYKIEDKEYKRLNDIKRLLSNFKIKNLNVDEEMELDYVKKHIFNSIKFFTKNKAYNKDISKSMWNKNNIDFLYDLSDLIKNKTKWLNKKIKLVDNKTKIDYNETFAYYGDLDNYKYLKFSMIVEEYLSDCPTIDFV
jgi:hypothetical protein